MPRNQARPAPCSGRLALLVGAAALAFAACGTAPPKLTSPTGPSSSSSTVGERIRAPDLRVALFDGGDFDLGEHLSRDGRPVLLNLWASSCPPCLEEMPYLDDAARRHPQVLFLGVAVEDDAATAATAAHELGVAYPLGADLDGTVDAAFPSPGLPATFLIGADGTLIGAVYGGLEPQDIEELVARYLAG
ncbi:MAG: TlpA disulfide reductase family protein [Actinomycetota bacterium]